MIGGKRTQIDVDSSEGASVVGRDNISTGVPGEGFLKLVDKMLEAQRRLHEEVLAEKERAHEAEQELLKYKFAQEIRKRAEPNE